MIKASHRALIHSTLLFAIWVAFFHETLLELVNAWQSSDTFTHCSLILPISLWLLWRRRYMLCEIDYRPSFLLTIPTIGCSILWLAASVTGIQVLAQLAAVSWLVFALWAVLGHEFMKVSWFPLAYLIFAVPIGDELVPQLQIVTANITVLLLQWSGIPVYIEGLFISIPSGLFEVAVACSGVRYLIASIALGTLYAHLQFYSIKRQFAFVVVAAIVPIIANGIRAYLIVILAHLSDMKLATGVDHLIYGWLFFGLVMFTLFWIGGKWRQQQAEPTTKACQSGTWQGGLSLHLTLLLLVLSVVVSVSYQNKIVSRSSEGSHLNSKALNTIFRPASLGSWQPSFSGANHYFTGKMTAGSQTVEIYVALYEDNRQGSELVNYHNLLYNPNLWTPEQYREITHSGISLGHYTIASARGESMELVYWYQMNDFTSPNSTKAKLWQSWQTLTSPPARGAVVVLATSASPAAKAQLDQAIEQLSNMGPLWTAE